MKKIFITLALLCSAIILIGAQTGFAWTNVNQGCLASGCHSAIQIHGVTAHGFSVGNCVACHSGAPAAGNVNSSTCAGCHTPSATDACELITIHGNPSSCLACHTDCATTTTTTADGSTTTTTVPSYEPPANDDFDNATPITVLPFTAFSNTREATPSTDDPTDCYGTNASVWYELTSITNIRIQVDTFGSDYDTVVAVYTGTRGSLNLIACWDYPCFTLDVQAGETYYFMVTSYYGMGGNLVFSVDVAPPPPPPLTIDLQVDPVNFVNNGITTVSGTVNSSAPLDFGYVSVQVRQKAGRVFITGYNNTYVYAADGRWTVQVSGDIGPFKAGKVTVRAIAEGCTSYASCPGGGGGQCVQSPEVSTTVRLQNSKQ